LPVLHQPRTDDLHAIDYCFPRVGDGGESYQWAVRRWRDLRCLLHSRRVLHSCPFPPLFTRHAIMIPKGRISFTHLAFYISTFIIATQLWSIWRQSASSYNTYSGPTPGKWEFDADYHANTHTLDHEQCDLAFPKLYHSLDQAVSQRRGRKVHINDIAIVEGRCMMRVMVYDGEVCMPTRFPIFYRIIYVLLFCMRLETVTMFPILNFTDNETAAICRQCRQAREMLRNEWQRTRAHPRNACPDRPRLNDHVHERPCDPEHRVLILTRRPPITIQTKGHILWLYTQGRDGVQQYVTPVYDVYLGSNLDQIYGSCLTTRIGRGTIHMRRAGTAFGERSTRRKVTYPGT
jgi:hypothetical protein